jgi:glycerophosphoryl diester phosphodiesterase
MTDILSWTRLSGPFLIGHRGYPAAARENTPESFEAALEAGCDGVEFDVRMTRDEVLVVHHDEIVEGPSGPISIEGSTWADLAAMRFPSSQGTYRVHTLAETLEALSGRCLLNVELKPPGRGRQTTAAERLITALELLRPHESVLVSSFDLDVLAALRRRDAGALLGFLFSEIAAFNHLEESEIAETLQAIHPRHDLVDRKMMRRAEEAGLMVSAWTADDPAEASRLVKLGVTAVITNRPDAVADALYEGLEP